MIRVGFASNLGSSPASQQLIQTLWENAQTDDALLFGLSPLTGSYAD